MNETYRGLTVLKASKIPKKVLIGVPGAGATVLAYQRMAEALCDESCLMIGLQARGFQNGETPFATVEEAAGHYIIELVDYLGETVNQLPIVVIGHSFGGWIAFELVQQLAARSIKIKQLVIVDTKPPHGLAEQIQPEDDVMHLEKMIRLFEMQTQCTFPSLRQQIRSLEFEAAVQALLSVLIQVKYFQKNMSFNLFRTLVQQFIANASTTYVPQKPYLGPAILWKASESGSEVTLGLDNIEFGWRDWLPRVPVQVVLANHINILYNPLLIAFVKKL